MMHRMNGHRAVESGRDRSCKRQQGEYDQARQILDTYEPYLILYRLQFYAGESIPGES
jgi:hypothetical protein